MYKVVIRLKRLMKHCKNNVDLPPPPRESGTHYYNGSKSHRVQKRWGGVNGYDYHYLLQELFGTDVFFNLKQFRVLKSVTSLCRRGCLEAS